MAYDGGICCGGDSAEGPEPKEVQDIVGGDGEQLVLWKDGGGGVSAHTIFPSKKGSKLFRGIIIF